jgi:hypothetical protein
MPVQLGTPAETQMTELLGVKLHRVRVSEKSQDIVLFPPAALSGVLLQDRDRGWKVVEPVALRR